MSTLCRGCGGTGLDHALTPRQVQMLKGIFYCHKPSSFNGATSNQVASLEIVPVDRQSNGRLSGKGPLWHVIERIEHYFKIGFESCDHDPEMLKEMACSWCHGTGIPQLSAAYMELAVST